MLLLILTISYLKTAVCIKLSSSKQVPHAEVLDELLTKFLGDSYSNNTLSNFILGETNNNTDANLTSDFLDINVLDVDTVKKIVNFAKKKYEKGMIAEQSRRQNDFRRTQAYYSSKYIVDKSFPLMLQTIYATKERMNVTLPFREKYSRYHSYKIAVLYGAGAAILGKMESLLAEINHFYWRTHFLWWLIIYEKLLACSIDISNIVENIFIVQKEFKSS